MKQTKKVTDKQTNKQLKKKKKKAKAAFKLLKPNERLAGSRKLIIIITRIKNCMVSNQMAASTKIGIGTGIGTGTAPTHHHRVAMSTLSPLHPPLSHSNSNSNSIFLFNSTLSTRHRSLRVNSPSGPHHLPALRVRAASSVDVLSSAGHSQFLIPPSLCLSE